MKERTLNLTVFLFFTAIFCWASQGISYEWSHDISKVHALNFLGAHYRASPLESSKPRSSFIFYFVPGGGYRYLNAIISALFMLGLVFISRKITGSRMEGLAAGIIFAASSRLASTIFFSTMSAYVALAVWAISFYLGKRYKLTALMLFLAGLSRPDIWLLSAVFIVVTLIRKEFRPVYLISLAAPMVWALVDFKTTGSFASVGQRGDFMGLAGIAPMMGMADIGKALSIMVRTDFGLPMLISGMISIIILCIRRRFGNLEQKIVLLVPIITVTTFYIGMALLHKAFLIPRYLILAVVLLCFFAALLPTLVSKKLWVRGLLLVLMVGVCFNGKQAVNPLTGFIEEQYAVATVHEACAWLKQRDLAKVHGNIIVGKRSDSYALQLGEKVSQSFITMAEVLSNLDSIKEAGMLIYTYQDCSVIYKYFQPLSVQGRAVINGMVFDPVYVTPNRLGVIYTISPQQHGPNL